MTARNNYLKGVAEGPLIVLDAALLFGRSISGPLQQVVVMIKELRNGHLSAPAEYPAQR